MRCQWSPLEVYHLCGLLTAGTQIFILELYFIVLHFFRVCEAFWLWIFNLSRGQITFLLSTLTWHFIFLTMRIAPLWQCGNKRACIYIDYIKYLWIIVSKKRENSRVDIHCLDQLVVLSVNFIWWDSFSVSPFKIFNVSFKTVDF